MDSNNALVTFGILDGCSFLRSVGYLFPALKLFKMNTGGVTMEIEIEKNPSKEQLKKLGVEKWPIWEKEVSEFPWHYDETEQCYVLEGRVIVTPKNGEPVEIKKGDLVTFPKGMSCRWKITQSIRKHYNFL
jgi:uncharacterized cupin superfamily protein